MSGWICSYRSIWDHPFFKGNGMRVAIWHWLLHKAAWKPAPHTIAGVKCTIRRGEVCFSQQQIQDDTGATRKQVREVLEWLLKRGKAVKIGANERANDGANIRANAKTILVIEKYDEYQSEEPSGANDGANDGATQGPTKEQDNNITTLEANASLSAGADEKDEIVQAVLLFKEFAQRQEWPIIRILSKSRRASLKARLRECGGLDGWRTALEKAATSNLCNGQNDRGWVCDFNFLVKQQTFTKLMEGSYDNRTPNLKAINGGQYDRSAQASDRLQRTVTAAARGTSGQDWG